ncbi:hypothetical protein PENSPDRAFT_716112 [Peniophora sp. CONT]|nr:hypothetical protein PENSPDRAFT_716112 [Peniophora sp. CONT]
MSAFNSTTSQLPEIVDDVKSIADNRVFPVLLESVLYSLFTVLIVFHGVKCCRLSPVISDRPSVEEALAKFNGNIEFVRDLCSMITNTHPAAIYAVDVLLDCINKMDDPPAYAIRFAGLLNGAAYEALTNVALSTTAFAQVFSTVIIARVAWIHRREVKMLLPVRNGTSTFRRPVAVLYIIVESGILYAVIWILYIIIGDGAMGLTAVYWTPFWMNQISVRMFVTIWAYTPPNMVSFQGIYPTLIVIIISLQASLLERSISSPSGLRGMSIQFADNEDLEATRTAAHPGSEV